MWSRLEKTLYRLQAQHACLSWAFGEIAGKPGPVVELGLGRGRTFDHLRRNLPGREIFVFDRGNWAYEDCQPDPAYLTLGEIANTFPPFAACMAGKVVLANTDIGYSEEAPSRENAQLASRLLPPVLLPGGIIMSDLELDLSGFEPVPLPPGAMPGAYFLYRRLP